MCHAPFFHSFFQSFNMGSSTAAFPLWKLARAVNYVAAQLRISRKRPPKAPAEKCDGEMAKTEAKESELEDKIYEKAVRDFDETQNYREARMKKMNEEMKEPWEST